MFEKGTRTDYKQESHTIDAAMFLEMDLKECLVNLAKELFGKGRLWKSFIVSSVTRVFGQYRPLYGVSFDIDLVRKNDVHRFTFYFFTFRYWISLGWGIFSFHTPFLGVGDTLWRKMDGSIGMWYRWAGKNIANNNLHFIWCCYSDRLSKYILENTCKFICLFQEILSKAGAQEKVGWAFGLGLERLAMRLYQIPDIRVFWSQDSGFLSQFNTTDYNKKIVYKVSRNLANFDHWKSHQPR